jgi:alkylation response protein AidB-like acyl-CoA dehydrogenase
VLADVRNTPGITVKPFLTTGGTDAFRDLVRTRVPQENRPARRTRLTMAKALLGHERTLIGGSPKAAAGCDCKRIAAATTRARRRCSTTSSSAAASRARDAAAPLEMAAAHAAAAQLGRAPGPESSIPKLVGTDVEQKSPNCMDGMGCDALGWLDSPEALPEVERAVASLFNYLRAASIYGGSNEIQRNIIAKQILRLPTA